jgi:hypothetical protein
MSLSSTLAALIFDMKMESRRCGVKKYSVFYKPWTVSSRSFRLETGLVLQTIPYLSTLN